MVTTWPRSLSSTRAATSPIPLTPTPRCRSLSITPRPPSTFTSPTPGQVITSLTDGVLSFTITTNKNIDLAALRRRPRSLVTRGPRRHPRRTPMTSRSRSIPPRSASTYLNKGTGGPGAEQITFSTLRRDHAHQQPLLGHSVEHRRRRRPRHRRQRAGQPRSPDRSRSPSHRWLKNLFVEAGSQRHHGQRHRGRPLRHDRRGHGRRRRRATSSRSSPAFIRNRSR